MAGTTTIPLVTLQNGSRTFGPAAIADADTRTSLTIDRTVTGGLNSLTAATTIEILIEQSNDGGQTWFEDVDATLFGGPWPSKPGTPSVSVTFDPGTSRQVRATLTVAGGPVVVQGSLTTS
jgi:hypothetical protein